MLWPMHPSQWMLELAFVGLMYLECGTDPSHIYWLPESINTFKMYLHIPYMCSCLKSQNTVWLDWVIAVNFSTRYMNFGLFSAMEEFALGIIHYVDNKNYIKFWNQLPSLGIRKWYLLSGVHQSTLVLVTCFLFCDHS